MVNEKLLFRVEPVLIGLGSTTPRHPSVFSQCKQAGGDGFALVSLLGSLLRQAPQLAANVVSGSARSAPKALAEIDLFEDLRISQFIP